MPENSQRCCHSSGLWPLVCTHPFALTAACLIGGELSRPVHAVSRYLGIARYIQ
jgi:hypothetical protein